MQKNETAYSKELNAMDERTGYYEGNRAITPKDSNKSKKVQPASMVRNIVSELVEAQVDSAIPMPKVTARREIDEPLAKTIEDFLRNELDRMPFEQINDMDERVCPVQGGDYFLVEWDADRHTHNTRGELSVTLLHPKQVIPQNGVNDINDMDYIIVRLGMSKAHVKEKYGISVVDEKESNPESRGGGSSADDVVTVNFGYFRNKNGGVGRFAWVNETVLEYLEDYQARQGKKCAKCDQPMEGDACQFCGSKKSVDSQEDSFTLYEDIHRSDGSVIPAYSQVQQFPIEGMQEIMMDPFTGEAMQAQMQQSQEPTKIPYYKPDIYPILLRKNVSAWGKVLGDSDVDKVKDQQNAIKKCDTRIQEKLDKGGSILTKHEDSRMEFTDEQLKIVEVSSPSEISCISVHNLQVDVGMDRLIADDNYQNARNIIGITDSFQGRQDRTATSGTAKQIAVAQSAGRLESKRIMKHAMYADLFNVMFKFLLAYSDEPRTVRHSSIDGSVEYTLFNKFDYLRQDEAGEWYWVDDFLFSVDNSSALAGNRESMWQETRMNFQTGAFGEPQNISTQILFWNMMSKLHYPLAADIKGQLEEMQQSQEAMQQAQQMQQMQPMGALPTGNELGTQSMDINALLGGGGNEMQ
ncbi:MAG: hypothetical protein VB047_12005 [Anaerotignum propionicum]|uniref:hypothetical protein n=1 Tax=Anaerotignum propionicum TaxID=28446 RepID=UPI002B200BAB|nr:hypothetical protein [Anaerotignum propionicum]MEA5058262.1 hypothetical protein [Anaerotignum propionicum]